MHSHAQFNLDLIHSAVNTHVVHWAPLAQLHGGAGFTLGPCLVSGCPSFLSSWLTVHMLMKLSSPHMVHAVTNPIQSSIWKEKNPPCPEIQGTNLPLEIGVDTWDVEPFSAESIRTQIHCRGPCFEPRVWPGSHLRNFLGLFASSSSKSISTFDWSQLLHSQCRVSSGQLQATCKL